MARVILLDTSPLGLACSPAGKPGVAQCGAWLAAMEGLGVDILIPEVCDYEVRRELHRLGAPAGLRRLDALHGRFSYVPNTTVAMRKAAELWAIVRQLGMPTAHKDALDADAILAGQASTVGLLGDMVTIATENLSLLSRFPGIDAAIWAGIR